MPTNLPGSFKYITKTGQNISIKYTIEIYFEKFRDVLKCKQEVEMREFLFTEEEIDQDWVKYEKFLNLRHVIKPNTAVSSVLALRDTDNKI